jgi:lysozyme
VIKTLRELLILHEGFSAKPYKDSVGKVTIGYGFNLDDVGLYPEECEFILANRIKKLYADMRRMLPWFDRLDDVRKVVLLDMSYNMGPEPFDFDGFKDWPIFLGQVERGEYAAAAKNMRSTLWYKQTKSRAVRLTRMMETGRWPEL